MSLSELLAVTTIDVVFLLAVGHIMRSVLEKVSGIEKLFYVEKERLSLLEADIRHIKDSLNEIIEIKIK